MMSPKLATLIHINMWEKAQTVYQDELDCKKNNYYFQKNCWKSHNIVDLTILGLLRHLRYSGVPH